MTTPHRRTPRAPASAHRRPPTQSTAGAVLPTAHATIVAQLRTAIHTGDPAALTGCLDPRLRHVVTPAGPTTLRDWLAELHSLRLRATAQECYVYPDAVVLGLLAPAEPTSETPSARFPAFSISDARIVAIDCFDDRVQALCAAYRVRPASGGSVGQGRGPT